MRVVMQVLHAAERADHQPVRVGRRPGDEVAVGDVAVVIGRQDQVLAALALVRAGEADVGDVALPDVVDEAQRVRGRLDHERPVGLEVQVVRAVGGLGVGGQHDVGRGRERVGVGEDVGRGLPDAAKARCASRPSTRPACSSGTPRRRASGPARRSCAAPCRAAAARRRTPAPRTATPAAPASRPTPAPPRTHQGSPRPPRPPSTESRAVLPLRAPHASSRPPGCPNLTRAG